VQSKTASSATGTAASLTLTAAVGAGNATFGAAVDFGGGARTPGSGYTEVHDISDFGDNFALGIETEYRLTGQAVVNATMGGGGWALIGIEIKAKP
jgi:hypothetical protein